ncbi:Na+/H+ antiporter NhaC family protein [Crassaminicella profunda]|uniref:Na+/H+ antiporter NhaC family protein n=1 Tax=Crassaminicella profunda TaxID=1286698 RepID=UPI001CA76DBC|nr:Na+/H+ antiporter NhaC family protein [Crassaminicella profunda]QZY56181.1 sodium:proton antiporter [Crassaminicella profunda]
MEIGWLSLLPIVLAIILAFTIKDVFISLLTGIIVSGIILDVKNKSLSLGFNSIYKVFQDDYAAKSILFCLIIGGFVYVIEASGGVHGMVEYLTKKKQVVKSQRGVQLITYFIGILMFIDATSSVVISGVAARPLFDYFHVSREKLAYITDSTSSPVAWLVPFNSAGAFLIAMISAQVSAGTLDVDPMNTIIATIPFQLYGIVSILIVGVVIFLDKDGIKENKTVNNKSTKIVYDGNYTPKIKNILVPIILLVGLIVGIMIVTGDGSTGIYIGVIMTLILTGIYYVVQGVTDLKTYSEWVIKGMSNYLGVTMILTLAFAFSNLVSELGTGAYIASISGSINPIFIPAMVFVLGAIMSFATGTSGGTVGILIPIVFPMAVSLQVAIPVVLGAIISGGLFGDHCSPISDSTILSSMIAEVQVMDHVTTQMPYALIAATISCVGFLILGVVI